MSCAHANSMSAFNAAASAASIALRRRRGGHALATGRSARSAATAASLPKDMVPDVDAAGVAARLPTDMVPDEDAAGTGASLPKDLSLRFILPEDMVPDEDAAGASGSFTLATFHAREPSGAEDDAGEIFGVDEGRGIFGVANAVGVDDGRMILGVDEGPCSHAAFTTPSDGVQLNAANSSSSAFSDQDMLLDMGADGAR